jgi:hypothetical protein
MCPTPEACAKLRSPHARPLHGEIARARRQRQAERDAMVEGLGRSEALSRKLAEISPVDAQLIGLHTRGRNGKMPTAHDRIRIAATAAVDPRTVLDAYKGKPIRSTCAARIDAAARILGLPLPPTGQPRSTDDTAPVKP